MWSFDPSRHLVATDGEQRRLEPKAVAVLLRLTQNPGRVVSKHELLEAAWPDQIVSEEVLTNAIYQIRRALADDARRPRIIETIPKRGYLLLEAPSAAETTEAVVAESRGGRGRLVGRGSAEPSDVAMAT